jgi:arylsulfatase
MKLRHLLQTLALLGAASSAGAQEGGIIHDAEYYVLKKQNAAVWAENDAKVDQMLAEFRDRNGGKPPNIFYILIDDMGFGDMGMPEMNAIRGYSTPNINDLADESMRFARMYTEPSCTPSRVAFMTGRQPHRNGMGDTAVDISGFGLADEEVTLAEVLKSVGYNTSHVGKWHMGDIQESWPTYQGFDYAAFPIHQQGQLAIFNKDAAKEEITMAIGEENYNSKYTLDGWFRPDPGHMITGLEATIGSEVREVHMEPGEEWTQQKYNEMNIRYQAQALEQLRDLAGKEEPFFLQYWPLVPLSTTRTTQEAFTTPNGGTFVESMEELDEWIGVILDEVEALGLEDNTLIVLMGDNGHFTKYAPGSGFSPLVFRGGKADTSEGGVRVDAFARLPSLIEGGSIVSDIIHIADLFTSIARMADATDAIPRDRIIDGVDQTSLMMLGDTNGRRDHVMIYSINSLKAVVKEHIKLNVPAKGENAIVAKFFNLFRDPREETSVSTEIGAWGGHEFNRIIARHLKFKKMYPDLPPAYGRPYQGIVNLRPETVAAVDAFVAKRDISPD